MSTRANVHSSDAIEAVRAALVAFVDQVGEALISLEAEMRRVQDWLEHDRPRHWKTQIRLAADQVNVAQAALHRCLMFPSTVGERPACYEEREELKKAQARQVYCHAKAERVRHWMRTLQHELFEYEGRISQLVRLVELDAPEAIGTLDRILTHLNEYLAIRNQGVQNAYNDLSLAKEIWPNAASTATPTGPIDPAPGESPSAGAEPLTEQTQD